MGTSPHISEDLVSLGVSISLAVVAGAAALGYGVSLGRLLRIRPNLGDTGILGLFCFGFLGILMHFVIALSLPVQVTVLSAGMVLAGLQWRLIGARNTLSGWTVAGICLVMLLHAQGLRQSQSDMDVYHLQTLRWIREFPIVPGLGNLHGRLAFNSAMLLMSTLIDYAGTRWVANLLLGTSLWISVFTRFQAVRTSLSMQPSDSERRIIFWILTLILGATAILPRLWGETWALNADIFAAYLIMYWVVLAAGYQESDRPTTAALMILSSALAVSVKISASPLLLVTAIFLVFRFKEWFAEAWGAVAFAGTLLAGWTGRSVLLSGCAIYPVRQTCMFSLPWAESRDLVYDEFISIKSWARIEWEGHYTRALRDWSWVGHWMRANWHQPLVALLVVGVSLGLIAVLSSASLRSGISADIGLVCAGIAGCVAFWFFSAPDVRFGAGFLFSTAALGLSLACAAWIRSPRLLSAVTPMLVLSLTVGALIAVRVILARPDFNLFRIPQVAVYEVDMANGRSVWVPTTGIACWDHPLPCTPYVDAAAVAKVRTGAFQMHRNPADTPPPGWSVQSSVNPFPEERYTEQVARRQK